MGQDVRHKSQKNLCSKCGHEKDLDDICPHCRSARAARSAIWYEQNATEASTRRAIANKLSRRFRPEEAEAIRQGLIAEQRGVCACCGGDGGAVGLSVEWSLDQVNDDGEPMLRAAICRRCKIAVNRYIRPSRFVLVPTVRERVEAYVRRSWQDPRAVLRRLGVIWTVAEQRGEVAPETDRLASTDRLATWLESIGATG